MTWSHFNPVSITAGPGSRFDLGRYVRGRTGLLITTQGMVKRGVAAEITARILETNWTVMTVESNPDLDLLDSAAAEYKHLGITDVVALGGGSVMDAAKALAPALASNLECPLSSWLRNGSSLSLPSSPPPPVTAIPTTAGTGAEVTPFATIWDRTVPKKRSLAGSHLFPRQVLLDPELTLSLPESETLIGALDAASHCLETLWNKSATPVSLTLAREGLMNIVEFFPLVEKAPNFLKGREMLQTAALLGGLAISQSRTAVAHSMSYPLTLRLGLPHGLACGFTLKSITAIVDREEKWPSPLDGDLAHKVVEIFEPSDPRAAALSYGTPDQYLELVSEMDTPERSGNFILESTPELFREILTSSLSTN